MLLHEVEEELNTAEKVREVTEELGASGLSAYPRLAALLRQYTSKEGKEQVELFKAAQDAGKNTIRGRYLSPVTVMEPR